MISLLACSAVMSQAAFQSEPLPALVVGSDAPALHVQEWIKGDPIRKFDNKKAYLIEFWATWCGPCLSGMRHLSQLQRKFGPRGLVVASITAPDDYGNALPAVRKLIDSKSSLIAYRIGWDVATTKGYENVFRGRTNWDYMGAAKAMAIPVSFLVDRHGRIAFIGLPSLADKTVEEVLSDKFDIGAAARSYAERKRAEPDYFRYEKLMDAKKWDEAYALAWRLARGPLKTDPEKLRFIADRIVDPSTKIDKRDLALAQTCAKAAVAAAGEDPGFIKTLACVKYRMGDLKGARQLMNRCIELSDGVDRTVMKKVLDAMSGSSPGTS